ncbi:MAG: LysR family transcriptional regulator [Hyphomicrobiales bacterium]|nr:LysR family transcriptional regulator [Hyphomicrobiales bacterium]
MKNANALDLDGHILRTFLVVLENSSVSAAAEQLNVTQSAVSHSLAKLRKILGDPLFVRSGIGVTPTSTAIALKGPVQQALDNLNALTEHRCFDPRSEQPRFVIAANDLQRDVMFPRLLRELRDEDISFEFEFIPSGHPSVGMMRDAKCHMALTPVPPDAPDILQTPLYSGSMMCFYDGRMRDPPGSWDEYCEADHLRVQFSEGHTSLDVLRGVDKSRIRRPNISVSNFNAIPPFIIGSRLIATELDLMQLETLKSLDVAPLPFESEPVTMYLVWHERSTNDPAHKWLRERIQNLAEGVVATMAVRQRRQV